MIRLQLELHDHILNLRSIENTLQKDFFGRLWEASSEEQRKAVKEIIMRGDKDALARWMESHPDVELGEMSKNKLIKLAQRLRVLNYSRLDRTELEDAINDKRNAE